MFSAGVKVRTTRPNTYRNGINEAGWVDGHVLAAAYLHQGTVPSRWGGNWPGISNSVRPRPAKKLPREFLLALTGTEVLAFKVTGVGGQEAAAKSWIKILEGVVFRCPIESVSISDLREDERRGATLTIEGESFPVIQALREGDPNTEPLFAMLAERSRAVA
jgi:hypothetical protein